ncbi:dihydrofolate reductase [Lederbergia galactosidilytica]|uniref:Dihydrofolate reductase n=1 Tax=Lederbergia galactosidilytica TaxID=217031 RepID=A0A177ZKE3_9BACI|nr:dihydrofolate reductase [Lederbergia galactosidilytica]MBP1916098.1 dihydrofolate reductase (trimethoprim resistance protein) [Lederbergia galactosidilytica]OAK68446.1 dihydrofolate reductase [Lederbergia galactosidilytica]
MLSLIVAMDKNRVIGRHNDIPWRIPNDWEYVKNTTHGHPIILGRKNFESIGRALPDRRNIILTRNKEFYKAGCEIANSVKDVFRLCENEGEIFIFGGEEIYKLFLPFVQKMYITFIHHEFEGDTFFPEIDFEAWKEISVKKGIMNDKNPYHYYFQVYERENGNNHKHIV